MWRIHVENGGFLFFKGNNTPINSGVTFQCCGATSKRNSGDWFGFMVSEVAVQSKLAPLISNPDRPQHCGRT